MGLISLQLCVLFISSSDEVWVIKQTQLTTFPFSGKLNESIQNPIIMILGLASPLPPSQSDGISHAISPNKELTTH